jgi:hypothetical protein
MTLLSPTEGKPSEPISRKGVQLALSNYNDLLKITNKYYTKILEMAQIASEFAGALESMAKNKGAEQSGKSINIFIYFCLFTYVYFSSFFFPLICLYIS